MALISTRGGQAVTASQAILRGIAPDGGLYVPQTFPAFSLEQIGQMKEMTYQQRAVEVMCAFLDDYTRAEIEEAVAAAYGAQFDDPAIAPLKRVSRTFSVLELHHGPTLAFKDMALQMLPHLMRMAMRKNGEDHEVFILVATSGDTGKAALEGFCDVPGTRCAVFYPRDGVSAAQKLQMVTQQGKNVHVLAVDGNFDDAQTGVKEIFADEAFKEQLRAQGRVLSSANSINFGRLLPQVVYYFSAYADMLRTGEICLGDKVNFCVPTGNFGNILAAYYARCCGLPVGKLICASNKNNVLADFLSSGYYNVKERKFSRSISPSMDILISSNLERLLFELCGRDAAQVTEWMRQLREGKFYDIGSQNLMLLQRVFYGGWATDEDTRAEISRTLRRHRYLVDPHTAVAIFVERGYRFLTGDVAPCVMVSTANPYKFGRDVLIAVKGMEAAEGKDDFACCALLAQETGTKIPAQIAQLPCLPVLHTAQCPREKMREALLDELSKA